MRTSRLLLHIAPVDKSTGKPVAVPITVLLGGRVLGTGLKESVDLGGWHLYG